jgi:hypothetical protein
MTSMPSMPYYIPLPTPAPLLGSSIAKDVGGLLTEFDAFQPDPRYSFNRINTRGHAGYTWGIIEPRNAPAIGDLPQLIQNLINATWEYAEPSPDNTKGMVPRQRPQGIQIGARQQVAHGITIGTRRELKDMITIGKRDTALPNTVGAQFTAQVRPTHSEIETTFPNKTAIASDWKLFKDIERTNSITFRGDSRNPLAVIGAAGGFYPPNSRKDQFYLENNVYKEFKWYLNERYKRELTQEDFIAATKKVGITMEQRSRIVDYMMWRKMTEKEAVHLGRMVENECLKGYMSTARSIDVSLFFATGYHAKPGWLYLTVVHGGFVVPFGQQHYWGSEEAEIAQWGPIPQERIVGFVHVEPHGIPDGPIFMRRSFRTGEPQAFEQTFKIMSGMLP